MAIFVGSDNNDSKIRDNRVGLAISTSNPSSPDTGDAYYNSTDNKLTVYNGSAWSALGGGGASVELPVSGSISNGQAVILNTDGTVGIITQTTSDTPSIGDVTTYNADKDYGASCYLSSQNTVILVYNDENNSEYFSIAAATISGSTVTIGSPTVVESESCFYMSIAAHTSQNYGVITYRKNSSTRLTYKPFSYNGSSFSFGSSYHPHSSSVVHSKVLYMSGSDRFFVQFRGGSGYRGRCYGIEITNSSDLSSSYGSEVTFDENQGCYSPDVAYDPDTDTVVNVWFDNSNNGSASRAKISSNNAITVGGLPQTYNNAQVQGNAIVYDTNANKFVSFYKHNTSKTWIAQIVSVSGYQQTSLTWPSGETTASSTAVQNQEKNAVVFDSHRNKIIFVFKSNGLSYLVVGTVSGSSITFGSTINWLSTDFNQNANLSFDTSQNKALLSYGGSSSVQREARTIDTQPLVTNLTAGNFIGFSDAAYTNGQTATIQIEGSVDDAQTGLTTAKVHYISPVNGTLSTTAGTPSVSAGIAITDTKIIVKG